MAITTPYWKFTSRFGTTLMLHLRQFPIGDCLFLTGVWVSPLLSHHRQHDALVANRLISSRRLSENPAFRPESEPF